jgi:replicative DNA helicase Mcm
MSEKSINIFQDFLKSFKSGYDEYKYRVRLSQLSSLSRKSLVVDFGDLLAFNEEWAEKLIEFPEEYLNYANTAATKQLKIEDPEYADEVGEIKVRIRKLTHTVNLRDIKSDKIGRLAMVEGVVVRVSVVKPLLLVGNFRCRDCNYTMEVPRRPQKCRRCGRKLTMELDINRSKFIDFQEIRIQERPEDLPPGQLPRSIDVVLREDLTDVARPGDRVCVVGIVKSVQEPFQRFRRRAKAGVFDLYIEGNYVDTLEKEIELAITPEEEKKIEELAKDPMLLVKLKRSIAPSIYSYGVLDAVKEAILYALFGGVPKVTPDGMHIRGDIHILIIGDPGTAKSQVLQYASQIAPRGLYTTGRGVSAAGLTAAVIKQPDGMALEAGALVLADKGVCCIDEIDKMRNEDRVAIHPAMEQQTVTISKGGIVATLNARTTIIAAGNPALGRYDPTKIVADNINLPVTILSRFDLIFILQDEPHRELDREMSEHILSLHMKGSPPIEPALSPMFLRKYITCAKRMKPRLTEEAKSIIREFYLKMRMASTPARESPIGIIARHLESLVRIAEARARACLRSEVIKEDAEAAINLWRRAYDKVIGTAEGVFDVDIIMTGKSKTFRDDVGKAVDVLRELEKKEGGLVQVALLRKRLQEEGMDAVRINRVIDYLFRYNLAFKPKDGYIKKL